MNIVYTYIRVSSKEQNTDRQHEALKEYATSNNFKYKIISQDRSSVEILKDYSKKRVNTFFFLWNG